MVAEATMVKKGPIPSASPRPAGAARISGAGVYKPGDSVTLVASPVEGWKFNNWTVDGLVVGTKSRLVYVMPGGRNGNGEPEPLYTLTVLASGSGDVTPKQEQKLAGATVFTATAKAKPGMFSAIGRLMERRFPSRRAYIFHAVRGPGLNGGVYPEER